MKIKKAIVWVGAATLITAFFMVMMGRDENTPPSKSAAEPNFFSFIQPMDNTSANDGTTPAAESIHNKMPSEIPQDQAILRNVPNATMKVAAVQQTAEKMRREGASEDDIYRMRAAELSADAAAQLARLDRNENAWKARVEAYLAERNDLLNRNAEVSGTDRQEALQQLRNARFTSEEQKLLSSYESFSVPQLKMD